MTPFNKNHQNEQQLSGMPNSHIRPLPRQVPPFTVKRAGLWAERGGLACSEPTLEELRLYFWLGVWGQALASPAEHCGHLSRCTETHWTHSWRLASLHSRGNQASWQRFPFDVHLIAKLDHFPISGLNSLRKAGLGGSVGSLGSEPQH